MTRMVEYPEKADNYEIPLGPRFITRKERGLFPGATFKESSPHLTLSFREMIGYTPSLSSQGYRLASLEDFDNLGSFTMRGNGAYLGIVVRGEVHENPESSLSYKLGLLGLKPTQENPLFIPSYALQPASNMGEFNLDAEKKDKIRGIPELSIHYPSRELNGAIIMKTGQAECFVGIRGRTPKNIIHTDWTIDESPLEIMITKI